MKSLLAWLLRAAFTLAGALAGAPAGAQGLVLDSSHAGAVNDLVYDSARHLLFSAGQDGTVRVWEPGGRLRASLRVSYRPVQRLALHPELPQFAALVGEPSKTDRLAAWDWERGRELFSLDAGRQLLHLAYAPQGGYLAYSRADYDSLAAVDARSGAPLRLLHGGGFGIVSFFVISRTGGTVMGYQPSGWITYWDLNEDRSVRQLRTLADLSLIRITPSNRHLLASEGDRLVAIDLLSGALAAAEPAAEPAGLALSVEDEQVLVAAETREGLQRWRFSGSSFAPLGPPALQEPALTALAYGPAGLYAGDRDGALSLVEEGGARRVLARNLILPVHDLAFRGQAAAAATPEGIYLFRSPALAGPLEAAAGLELAVLPAPFPAGYRLEFLDDRRLLAWQQEPGELAAVELATGASQRLPVALGSSLQQVSVDPLGLILVERGGLCRILDPVSLATRFRYSGGAVNHLTPTRGDLLVGAGAAGFGNSLFQVNARTGETVPIRDPSLFVYDLLYSPSRSTLYSLAVESSPAGSRTVLAAHSGRQLDSRRVLASFAGEDLGASLAEGPTGTLYSSLGFGPLVAWDGTSLSQLENPGCIARRLRLHEGRIYAVNADSSISLWDKPWLPPWRMYLLAGGEWALLGPQGQAYATPGARPRILQVGKAD